MAHLRDADPRLGTLIDEVGELGERSGRRGVQPHDYYGALVRAIIGQQLSSKVAFLRSLAEHVTTGELDLERLSEEPDERVTAELVAVKGIGEWTADMFLIFQLDRPDVLPVGDLGIRAAFRRLYDLPELPSAAEMERIAEPWRPYRSTAARFLWRSLDNEPA